MRKATIFLMALAALALATAAPLQAPAPAPPLRRSRFLASANFPPPASFYDCRKKPPSICLEPGSPGATCCKGTCVDTEHSFQHCGSCNKTCRYTQTCCEGKCVNTFTDKKNCGGCGVRCRTRCTNGYCDYAA
ncbi:stigma-specific STIG1-like protein 1 [Panicum miliaceum]|uniref:Stigma-specific STIG1-like protein 1 n=1 Tax=Panicum miliaceum TaxID=4540 RepID=A0A3L6R1F2_PANMI|nr:stigma-specific STIG1-like protein 1 [Panicum miliaceum]